METKIQEFASGVYGKVYDDGEGYVYKVFYTENKNQEAGWIREIIVAKNLFHPNIIHPKFIGFNFTPDPNIKPPLNIYIKMKKYLRIPKLQFPLNDYDVLQAMLDLTNGLAYMHSKFIMHRDIKEANLLYEPPTNPTHQIGKLVICDFSLARFCIKTNDIKHFNYLTPETVTSSHRAPEIFQAMKLYSKNGMKNQRIEYNELVDVWSAGIVMFYLLTGLQLYYAIFYFQKNNPMLLSFIASNDRISHLEKKSSWCDKDREQIYSELLLSINAIPFIISLLDKYINPDLKYKDFYKNIFISCISVVEERSSALDIVKSINKLLLDNDLTDIIIDRGFIECDRPSRLIESNPITDKFVSSFMSDALVRIKANDVKGLITSKISLIMNRFCQASKKPITEINPTHIIAAAHIVEIMFLYEEIFTVHFNSSRNKVYRYINELFYGCSFLEALF